LWGDNIYNTDAAGQYVHLQIYAGDFRRVYISIQNDRDVADSFTVCACSFFGASETGFGFRYFIGRGDVEITAAVAAGTFTTPTLAPGEQYVIRARVAVSSAASHGPAVGRSYTLKSTSDTSKQDVVAIWVQRR
jgi:hypothetical protein